ncbi:MAG: KaiC domain-containing protein [Methanospirillum sp.]|nr:KaiC domain-containing protein [Methanospirillum sp.]
MAITPNSGQERVSTGIEGLDEMLAGGLVRGSITAIVGAYGTGKTTCVLEFLYDGLRRGETAIYISPEETEDSILGFMAMRGRDVGPYRNRSFFVLKLDPTNFNLSVNTIRNELPPLIRKVSATRVVFDPVSLFEDLFESDSGRRNEMYRFVELLREQHCTMVMTSETTRDNPLASRHNLIEYLADTVILLRYVRPDDFARVNLAVEVVKMRHSPHSREIRPYEIGAEDVRVLPAPGTR